MPYPPPPDQNEKDTRPACICADVKYYPFSEFISKCRAEALSPKFTVYIYDSWEEREY